MLSSAHRRPPVATLMSDSDIFDLQAPRAAPAPSEPVVDRDQADFSDLLPQAHVVAPLVEPQWVVTTELAEDARTVTAPVREPSPGPAVPVPRYVLLADARTAPKPLPVPKEAALPPPPPPAPYAFVEAQLRPAPPLTEAAAVAAAVFAAAEASRLAHRQRVDGAVRLDHLAERLRLERSVLIWAVVQTAIIGWGIWTLGGAVAGAGLGLLAGWLARRATPLPAMLAALAGLALIGLVPMLRVALGGRPTNDGTEPPLTFPVLLPPLALLVWWWWWLLRQGRDQALLAVPVVATSLLRSGTVPSVLVVHGEHVRQVAVANDCVAAMVRLRKHGGVVGAGMLWIWLTAWLQWFTLGGGGPGPLAGLAGMSGEQPDLSRTLLALVGGAGAWLVVRLGGGAVTGMLGYGLPVALAGGVLVAMGLAGFQPLLGFWVWAAWVVSGGMLGLAVAQADVAVRQRTG